MKKEKAFFYCILKLSVAPMATGRARDSEHLFHELVELEKDETVPVAFDKWLSQKSVSLLQGIDEERISAKTTLINMYVITE